MLKKVYSIINEFSLFILLFLFSLPFIGILRASLQDTPGTYIGYSSDKYGDKVKGIIIDKSFDTKGYRITYEVTIDNVKYTFSDYVKEELYAKVNTYEFIEVLYSPVLNKSKINSTQSEKHQRSVPALLHNFIVLLLITDTLIFTYTALRVILSIYLSNYGVVAKQEMISKKQFKISVLTNGKGVWSYSAIYVLIICYEFKDHNSFLRRGRWIHNYFAVNDWSLRKKIKIQEVYYNKRYPFINILVPEEFKQIWAATGLSIG